MKVVIPVGALHVGGGCKVLAETANALTARGHDTEIIMPAGAPVAYNTHSKLTEVPSLTRPYIPYGDIVLPNFYTTFKAAYEAWPAQCVRFSLGFEPYWIPDKDYAIWTYSRPVPCISISHWLDNQIYNHTKKRGTVVNLGVDPSTFHPREPKKPMNGRPAVLLYIARDPQAGYMLKGYYDFIHAIRLLRPHYSNFIVHMICTERELALPAGIPYKTFRPKTAEEMADLYREADVFISTSWFEGFAIPPLEAMACGTPVVTTNSGGLLDFCEHMKSAYIVPPRKPAELFSALLTVLKNSGLRRSLRENGLLSAAKFTQQRFEKEIVDTLEAIHASRTGGNS